MRTTVTLDEDAYSFASAYARGKGTTLSAAISELLRRAEQAPEPKDELAGIKMGPHGYLIISGTGDVVTSEMVKQYSEDEIV